MTKGFLITAAAFISTGLLVGGCGGTSRLTPIQYGDQGRPDAAMDYERRLQTLSSTDLDFDKAPVRDVIKEMQAKFGCRIEMSKLAAEYISENDTRVTAQVESIPANLAFAVMRAELEMKGLVLVSRGNALGKPSFLLDRNTARELTSGAPAKGGTDF